jgi:hypothetical protein
MGGGGFQPRFIRLTEFCLSPVGRIGPGNIKKGAQLNPFLFGFSGLLQPWF